MVNREDLQGWNFTRVKFHVPRILLLLCSPFSALKKHVLVIRSSMSHTEMQWSIFPTFGPLWRQAFGTFWDTWSDGWGWSHGTRMNLRPNQNRTEGPCAVLLRTLRPKAGVMQRKAQQVAMKASWYFKCPRRLQKDTGKLSNPSWMSWLPQNNQMR